MNKSVQYLLLLLAGLFVKPLLVMAMWSIVASAAGSCSRLGYFPALALYACYVLLFRTKLVFGIEGGREKISLKIN